MIDPVNQLIRDCRNSGIELEVSGKDLVIRGAQDVLTDELVCELRKRKPELIHMLLRESPIQCDRCGQSKGVQVDIHGGRSTRIDCMTCGRFFSFARWYQ